jgi:hypothetical protein
VVEGRKCENARLYAAGATGGEIESFSMKE